MPIVCISLTTVSPAALRSNTLNGSHPLVGSSLMKHERVHKWKGSAELVYREYTQVSSVTRTLDRLLSILDPNEIGGGVVEAGAYLD